MAKINRVLLIDDSESLNLLHEAILSKHEIANEIVSKTSVNEAIDYLERGDNGKPSKPNLIFLDVEMPTENGFDFLERYKELSREVVDIKNTVIVIVSKNLTTENFTKFKSYQLLGVEYQVRKPFDEYDLEDLLLESFDIDLNLS